MALTSHGDEDDPCNYPVQILIGNEEPVYCLINFYFFSLGDIIGGCIRGEAAVAS